MQVRKGHAAITLAGAAAIAIYAQNSAPTIDFGPFFLLICAFGAWFVGNPFAILLGVLIAIVQQTIGNVFARDDGIIVVALQFFSALAVVLMLGVARAALEIEWRFARIDNLTGALNRKAFFESVESEVRQPGITVLIFADVDGLKSLNDRLGHEAGDEALQDFAYRVRKTIRKSDVFARIGGDEFVIYLKVRDIMSAELVAQRLHTALNLVSQKDATKLTCSIGVLVLPAGSKSIDAELKQADNLMYYAKKEKLGLAMAVSVKGDLQKLVSVAPSVNLEGRQRAVVRSSERGGGLAALGNPSENSINA